MASEFDNEIDFLLRKTARQTILAPENAGETNHLDADDLTAFAENALPQFARLNFISHLADCNSCREILSNLILLNENADEEAVSVAEQKKAGVTAKSSWLDSLKKLFAFPTLGYATAVLAVLFVGIFAFVALRPVQNNQTAQMVQTEALPIETPTKKRPSAPTVETKDEENQAKPEESPAETPNSNANVSVDNTPAPTIESAENLPPSVRLTRGENSGNRNVASSEATSARSNSASANSTANSVAAPRQPEASVANGATVNKQETPNGATAGLAAAPKPIDKAKDELLSRNKQDQAAEAEDSAESAKIVPPAPATRSRAATDDLRRELKKVVETRTVNGRAFQKVGGVWTDAAYSSQNVTNVSRGSGEYKKLDNGLRSIAERLSGEIIIVWQGRAYKIR